MNDLANSTGYASVAFLNDIIGGILGVIGACCLVALGIAFLRYIVFQDSGKPGSSKMLSDRALHILGAVIAITIVYNLANVVYDQFKDNPMSDQVEAESEGDEWTPTNIDEVLGGMNKDSGQPGTGGTGGTGSAASGGASPAQSSGSQGGSGSSGAQGASSGSDTSAKAPAASGASSGASGSTSGGGLGVVYHCQQCGKSYSSLAGANRCQKSDLEDARKSASKTSSSTASGSVTPIAVTAKDGSQKYRCAQCSQLYKKFDKAMSCAQDDIKGSRKSTAKTAK